MILGAHILIYFLWFWETLGERFDSGLDTSAISSTTISSRLVPVPRSSAPSATITAPASLTKRAVYDPNTCRQSWEYFVKSNLKSYSEDLQQQEDFSIESSLGFGSISVPNTSYSGTFTKILGYTWSTCDGIPRFRSTGKSLWTDGWEEPHFRTTFSFVNGTQIHSPASPANPQCTISHSDCDEQFSSFARWTTQFPSKSWNNLLQTDALAFADHWRYVLSPHMRYFAPSSLTVLGGCQLEKNLCSLGQKQKLMADSTFLWNLKTVNTQDAEATESAYFSAAEHHATRCLAQVGRVVAVYFPPNITSRDICANNFAGTDIKLTNDQPTEPVTATLTAVSFSVEQTHLCPRGAPQTGLECIEADRKLSWSTMYGNWTFTSPSIYLAYDKATMWRGCSQLGSAYPGGMLTLAPTDVKTFRYALVTDYTPPPSLAHLFPVSYTSRHDVVDLADLAFPAPAEKYYSDLPFCKSELTVSTCTTASGTESCVQRVMSDLWTKVHNCTDTMSEGENLYYYNTYSIPKIFTDIDPEWKSCNGFENIDMGVRDPPIALSIAGAISTPSLPEVSMLSPSPEPVHSPLGVPAPTGVSALGENRPVQVITVARTVLTLLKPLGRPGFFLGDNSLAVGGSPGVIGGQTVSLAPAGLVLGTKTIALPPSPATAFKFTVDGKTVTGYNSIDGQLVVGATAISAGGPAYTTGGRIISMGSSGPLLDGVSVSADPSTGTSDSTNSGTSNGSGKGSSTSSTRHKSNAGRLSVPYVFTLVGKIIIQF